MQDSAKIIRTLYQISADHHLGIEHQAKKMLTIGRHVFDMEIGIVSRIEDQLYTILYTNVDDKIDLGNDDSYELSNTFCAETIKTSIPLAIENIEKSNIRSHPAYKAFALKSYIGATIFVKGRVFGTVNFSSPTPRKRSFTESDTDAIQLMAIWIGSEFDRLEDEQHLQSAYDKLKLAEEKFRLGIEASPSAMIMTNSVGEIVYINRLAENMFGYLKNEIINQSIEILVPEDIRHTHAKDRTQYNKMPAERLMGSRRNLTARKKNGDIFPVEVGLNPINTPEGPLVLCAVTDLTERKRYETTILNQANELKKANRQLVELATKDSLTNAANRRSLMSHFEIMLAQASRNGKPLSFIMIDIDDFKSFNDTFGHLDGDTALKTVCEAITEVARRSDIVARFGGEEFALLLPDTDAEGALIIAERCRETIEQQTEINHKITASFGVSTIIVTSPLNTSTKLIANTLIGEADRALYFSKEHGKNIVTHHSNC